LFLSYYINKVCKRWQRLLEEAEYQYGLELHDVSPCVFRRCLQILRPERLANVSVEADRYDGDAADRRRWRDLDAALLAASPRLRPSFRFALGGLTPRDFGNPAESAALVRLLNRHAGQLQTLDFDLTSVWRLDTFVERSAAVGGPFDPSNAFLPAIQSLRFQMHLALPDNLFQAVPFLGNSLQEVYLTTAPFAGIRPVLSGGPLRDLRRLTRIDFTVDRLYSTGVVLDGSLASLTALKTLNLGPFANENMGSITLQDPDGWLDRPRAALFPALETAHLSLLSLQPPSLARLLPALHHVTSLELRSDESLDEMRAGLEALSRIEHLTLVDKKAGDPACSDGYYTIPFPQTLKCLGLFLHFQPVIGGAPPPSLVVSVPAAFLSLLPNLISLEIYQRGAGVHFEPLAADLPNLEEIYVKVGRISQQIYGPRPLSVFALMQRCPALRNCAVQRGNWRLLVRAKDRADAAPWTEEGQEGDFEGYESH
jgi:hypothetical protein